MNVKITYQLTCKGKNSEHFHKKVQKMTAYLRNPEHLKKYRILRENNDDNIIIKTILHNNLGNIYIQHVNLNFNQFRY